MYSPDPTTPLQINELYKCEFVKGCLDYVLVENDIPVIDAQDRIPCFR